MVFLGNQQYFYSMVSPRSPYLDSQTDALASMLETNLGDACNVSFAPSGYYLYYGGLTYDQWKATQA